MAITALNLVGLETLVFIYRPLMWGLIYAPTSQNATILLITVIPTLILEGIVHIIAFTAILDFIMVIAKPNPLGKKSELKHRYTI